MQIRLLGGVDARTDGGARIDVGPAKCQLVLGALALSPGSLVPVPRLVELVWGEHPPRTAEKTLQSYITRLRKGLGHDAIERVGAGYRLAVDPATVDVARFQRHLANGETNRALGEWVGIPLAGLEAPGLTGVVDGLVEQYLGAREIELQRLVEHDLVAAVAELTELTAQHPFREALWALLMTALYRGGRQADALAAYHRARDHLVEGLGVEPGPQLRELEQLILGHDVPLSGRSPSLPTGTVTFAFSDIEGSSRLWVEHRGAMASAVERHDEIIRAAVGVHEGHVFSTGGDSFGVAFHRVTDAVAWARDVQEAVRVEPWDGGVVLAVRIGIHTGEAEERGRDYFGPAVNLTSRIASAGHGGQTLLSRVSAGIADQRDVKDLGIFRLADVAEDIAIFQLGHGEHPPLRTERSDRGNLPRRGIDLFGREPVVEQISDALGGSALVTLIGPGGIGKTRLALAVARVNEAAVDDGAWLVELADITSGSDVARRVASVLGADESAGSDPSDAVARHLAERNVLLVLDNCEHVVEAAAERSEVIANRCPGVRILATSREGLGIDAERIVVVGPLDIEQAAVDLFTARATAVDPSYVAAAHRSSAEEICRQLDGLPLAIELAAARVHTMTPADLVDRLDDHLRLLDGGRRRSVARHRTLRSTIGWSHDLLDHAERAVLHRLSIFAGSFDLAAVEAVVGGGDIAVPDVDDVLGRLVERSMVVTESGAFGRRFRLLETIRQFAAEQLAETGAAGDLAAWHARYICTETRRIGDMLAGHDEAEGAQRLVELWPNLRAAVDWGLSVGDLELVTETLIPIGHQSFVRRGLGELADWSARLAEATPAQDEETQGWALLWASMQYSMTQDRDRYQRLHESVGSPDHLLARYGLLMATEDEAIAALDVGPDMVVEMRRRGQESYARLFEVFTAAAIMSSGDFAEALKRHEELADLFRAEGPPSYLTWALYLMGASAAFGGDPELADRCWDESIAVHVPPGTNSPNEVLSARADFRRGDHRRAYQQLIDYIDELIEDDNMAGAAMVGIDFVNMMVAVGRLDLAGVIVGHFDSTGLMGVEGPGFKMLIQDAVHEIAGDTEAMRGRERTADEGMDDLGALRFMSAALAPLLQDLAEQQA